MESTDAPEDTLAWLERRAAKCEDMAKISHSAADEYARSAARYRHHADHVRGLRAAARAVRDDINPRNDLMHGFKPNGRIVVDVSQEIWNNFCAAIGDVA